MQTGWKECDDVAKAVFNKLSEESREVYRQQMKEYDDLCKALGITKQKQTRNTSKKKKERKHTRDDESPAFARSKPDKKKKGDIPDALSSPPMVRRVSSSSHDHGSIENPVSNSFWHSLRDAF